MSNMNADFDWSAYIAAMSALHELPLDDARRLEVAAQLRRIHAIAQKVLDFPLPPDVEQAPTFRP